MIKFGVYYIPKEGNFYNLGSKLIGYDIRSEQETKPLDGFDQLWNKNAREYGFHLTMTDAVYIKEDELGEIEAELSNIINLLSMDNEYILEASQKPVSFWRGGGDQVALRFVPNLSAMMLHSVLVCLLQTMGNGSFYSEMINHGKDNFSQDMVNKTNRFFSPYVLDEFKPHFTLLNPYLGSDHKKIEENLSGIFGEIKSIKIDSLCLVTQSSPEIPFKIQKEFMLG